MGAVHWDSKLSLTMPFSYSGKSTFEDEVDLVAAGLPDDLADYTTALDVDWENTFAASITKTISVKLFVRWVYDKYDNSVTPWWRRVTCSTRPTFTVPSARPGNSSRPWPWASPTSSCRPGQQEKQAPGWFISRAYVCILECPRLFVAGVIKSD